MVFADDSRDCHKINNDTLIPRFHQYRDAALIVDKAADIYLGRNQSRDNNNLLMKSLPSSSAV